MTALLPFPATDTMFARLTERQKQANIAAERDEHRQAALFVIRNHAWHSRQEIEDAWVSLALYGTDHERDVARDKIAELSAETPMQVVREHRDRWPAILLCGAFGAAILLSISGWM